MKRNIILFLCFFFGINLSSRSQDIFLGPGAKVGEDFFRSLTSQTVSCISNSSVRKEIGITIIAFQEKPLNNKRT